MTDEELTYEEAIQRLHELCGAEDDPAPKRKCRRYLLEFKNGDLIFRFAQGDPSPARSEAELIVDQLIAEEFGEDIVPRKLAELFPGSSKWLPPY